jgi:uncharacterized protein (DUF4415 family)
MISDEPDEDADTVDDETLLETCVGAEPPKRDSSVDHAPDMPDFPRSRKAPNVRTDLDAGTLAWFKANHADWQQQIGAVLRAWVAARSRA